METFIIITALLTSSTSIIIGFIAIRRARSENKEYQIQIQEWKKYLQENVQVNWEKVNNLPRLEFFKELQILYEYGEKIENKETKDWYYDHLQNHIDAYLSSSKNLSDLKLQKSTK